MSAQRLAHSKGFLSCAYCRSRLPQACHNFGPGPLVSRLLAQKASLPLLWLLPAL